MTPAPNKMREHAQDAALKIPGLNRTVLQPSPALAKLGDGNFVDHRQCSNTVHCGSVALSETDNTIVGNLIAALTD
jgi:hypothetical protein